MTLCDKQKPYMMDEANRQTLIEKCPTKPTHVVIFGCNLKNKIKLNVGK